MAFPFLAGNAETALSPTATPAQALGVAFSMKWVDRLQRLGDEVFFKFLVQHEMPLHQGKQLVIEKSTALSLATTPLLDEPTSGTLNAVPVGAPFQVDYTLTNLVLTPLYYGNDMGWTTRQELTHNDILVEKRSNELAINAVESCAQLVANEFDQTLVPNVWTSFTFARMVSVGRTFRQNRVRGFDELGGNFVGAIGPFGWEDILTEGSPKYADNYQTRDGSNQIASGQLEKAFLGFQLFVTNYQNTTLGTLEDEYFWGYDGIVSTELVAGVVGLKGRRIPGAEKMPSLIGYLIPAEANNNDHYGLKNWAVWRGGPLDFALSSSTQGDRVYSSRIVSS